MLQAAANFAGIHLKIPKAPASKATGRQRILLLCFQGKHPQCIHTLQPTSK